MLARHSDRRSLSGHIRRHHIRHVVGNEGTPLPVRQTVVPLPSRWRTTVVVRSAAPLGVNRNSGSAVRFLITVITVLSATVRIYSVALTVILIRLLSAGQGGYLPFVSAVAAFPGIAIFGGTKPPGAIHTVAFWAWVIIEHSQPHSSRAVRAITHSSPSPDTRPSS